MELVSVNCNGIIIQVSVTVRSWIYKCKNLHLKLAKTANHLCFLRRCRRNQLVPKGLTPSIIDVPRKQELQFKFGREVLQELLRKLYGKRNKEINEEKTCRGNIIQAVSPQTWIIIWTWILVQEHSVFVSTRKTQINKFEKLLLSKKEQHVDVLQAQTKCKVMNLSSHVLTKGETLLLEKGLNFVPTRNNHVTTDIIANTEVVAKRLGGLGQIAIHETKSFYTKKNNSNTKNLTRIEQEGLETLKKTDNLVITNSDKGNVVVLMEATDYEQKLNNIVNGENYKLLKFDPTSKAEATLRRVLNKIKKEDEIDKKLARNILNMNLKVPTIYGCPKIFKSGIPLRPVVSTVGTWGSELGKFLCTILNKVAYPTNSSSLKNSQEFSSVIRNRQVPDNYIMGSLDVINLFGSVPVDDCLHIVQSLLEHDVTLQERCNMSVSHIMELIGVSVKNSYFKHNDKFYEQTNGLAMGSPLSPALAEIYLTDLEQKICKLELYNQVDLLRKYVDDYFVLWMSSMNSFLEFKEEINKIDKNIQFTMELECNNEISFLDLKLRKDNGKIKTLMFEKEGASGNVLNYESYQPASIKRNIVTNLMKKIEVCSDSIGKDKAILRNKLKDNNYPEKLTKSKIQANIVDRDPEPEDPLINLVLPYNGNGSEAFKRKCKDLGIKVCFSNNRNVGDILGKRGKEKGDRVTNVIYKIKCECGANYVGETCRELSVRVREHERAVEKNNSDNGIAVHVANTGHKIDFKGVEVLDREHNTFKRKYKEAYYIAREGASMNKNDGYEISNIWEK